MSTIELYCDRCSTYREFEQPPCTDGHDVDCPERVCVACGGALLLGFPVTRGARRQPPAPTRRHRAA